jgi:hypothetical protein
MDTKTTPSLRGLEEIYLLQDADNAKDGSSLLNERFGLFVFLVTGCVALVLFVSMIVREFYWRKYGLDVCPGAHLRSRPRGVVDQIDQDREMAEELQRRLHEEEREAERQTNRKERQAWYESYIQPFTFVSVLFSSTIFLDNCCI